MNNPFDYIPDASCNQAFNELNIYIETLRRSGQPEDVAFCRALDDGVMLGVLIATDQEGNRHNLYAFSGQLGADGFHHEGFVGPAFDYLKPDGYFKTKEAEISHISREINRFENGVLTEIQHRHDETKRRLDNEVANYKELCRRSKAERDALRNSGTLGDREFAELTGRSQFEKAELHRIKKRAAAELEPFSESLKRARMALEEMKQTRRTESERLQSWLFSNFRLLNARGDIRSLSDIFAETTIGVPPSGAGECCAPKLLQAAFVRGWNPVAMAEYWYGKEKEGSLRRHGEHYPACRGRCLPVLGWMLQGLEVEPPLNGNLQGDSGFKPEIIFENRWFCVVNKPSGMLSVPGKGSSVSVQEWLIEKFGADRDVKVAHRLDQDTSGLLVATFGERAYKEMQSLFARRKVEKLYIADLEGDYSVSSNQAQGRISLPLSADWLDRPRQRIDHEKGKEAITDYRFLSVSDGISRVEFHPQTGRTHQLRVHAASGEGLSMPIAGDRLYGLNGGKDAERLHLHAHRIEFTFPLDGNHYCFESPVPF